LGDIGISMEAAVGSSGSRLSFGATFAAPTGRAGCGPGRWRAGASVESALVLDPVAVAARVEAAVGFPRGCGVSAAAPEIGLGLSFAEALNARISVGFSARLGAAFARGDENGGAAFAGGAGMAAEWAGDLVSYRAGLSCGLGEGSSVGPALDLGLSCAIGGE
jgi:hypothetical protein